MKILPFVILISLQTASASPLLIRREAVEVKGASQQLPTAPAIGSTIEDFDLSDLSGTTHTLQSLEGEKGTVLIFVSARCPFSKAYNERMEKLSRDYKSRGITVIGLNANAPESAEEMKTYAAENKLSFTILKDEGNRIADRLGAMVTPEAYLLDTQNKLLYHGRIDNARDLAAVNSNDLRNAIDSLLAGKNIDRQTAKSFGCTIARVH